MKRMLHAVLCPIVFLLLYERNWQEGVLKPMKNDHLLVFSAIWVLFLQVFGQVKEWLILELHKIIRMSHLVIWSIVSPWFYERGWQGIVLKVLENNCFSVFLVV